MIVLFLCRSSCFWGFLPPQKYFNEFPPTGQLVISSRLIIQADGPNDDLIVPQYVSKLYLIVKIGSEVLIVSLGTAMR